MKYRNRRLEADDSSAGKLETRSTDAKVSHNTYLSAFGKGLIWYAWRKSSQGSVGEGISSLKSRDLLHSSPRNHSHVFVWVAGPEWI